MVVMTRYVSRATPGYERTIKTASVSLRLKRGETLAEPLNPRVAAVTERVRPGSLRRRERDDRKETACRPLARPW
jgi:hypothetical protein